MANWQGHETHPTGHNTSEVDLGGHDPNPRNMNESLLSEVDWGAHDSSVFLFWLTWIVMQDQRNSSSKDYGENYNIEHLPFLSLGSKLILWLLDKLEMIFSNFTPINPDLDDPEQLTGESIQSFLTLVGQLQWLMILGRLITHAQATTLSKLKLTQKKLQRAYGYILQITEFYWTQSKYYLHETLIKHWDPFKFAKWPQNYS